MNYYRRLPVVEDILRTKCILEIKILNGMSQGLRTAPVNP